jgi:hypothetical protein
MLTPISLSSLNKGGTRSAIICAGQLFLDRLLTFQQQRLGPPSKP